MPTSLSIIVPYYNASKTIDRALNSLGHIALDRRPSVQVILIDDGSIDDGLSLARRHAESKPEFSWDFHVQANAGANNARNKALSMAQGQWIFFLDADDELLFDPTTLIADAGDTSCFAMTLVYKHGNHEKHVSPPQADFEKLFWDVFSSGNPFQPSCLLFRRNCITALFDADIRTCEDWLFFMENPNIFRNMKICGDIQSARIHIHSNNTSSNYQKMGKGRTAVARKILYDHGATLTRKQKNNFLLQEQIGNLRSGGRFLWGPFFRGPCHCILYAKAMVYLLARFTGLRATRYQG